MKKEDTYRLALLTIASFIHEWLDGEQHDDVNSALETILLFIQDVGVYE